MLCRKSVQTNIKLEVDSVKKILILANSSGGLYDFRNDFVLGLLKDYEVYVSIPDEVKTKELAEEGCKIIKTPINRRGVNPVEDFKLFLAYRKLMKEIKPDLVATYTIKPNIYGGAGSFPILKPLPDWEVRLTVKAYS